MSVLLKNKLNISNQATVECKMTNQNIDLIQEVTFEQLFAKIYLHC